MDSQYLSLAEYSNKYNISVSTLRRRIRNGQFPYSLKFGKYFLEDQSPAALNKRQKAKQKKIGKPGSHFNPDDKKRTFSQDPSASFSAVMQQLKPEEEEVGEHMTDRRAKDDLSAVFLKDPSFLLKMMDSQKELYSQIEKKEEKINEQQNQIADLNTLVALLEKENKELKSLLYQEKEMEEWLELN